MLRKIIITLGVFLTLVWGLSSAQAVTWQECYTQGPEEFNDQEIDQCHEILRYLLAASTNSLNQCKASQTQTSQTTYRSLNRTTQPLQIYSSPSGSSIEGGIYMPPVGPH